jgi:hypothetical protein
VTKAVTIRTAIRAHRRTILARVFGGSSLRPWIRMRSNDFGDIAIN